MVDADQSGGGGGGGGASGSHVTDSRLMRDLENDCVDRDIYDEVIRSRQNHDPTYVIVYYKCPSDSVQQRTASKMERERERERERARR